jgi:hypothetical protein
VKTPLLDKILAKQMPLHHKLLKFVADYWVMILIVTVFGALLAISQSHC